METTLNQARLILASASPRRRALMAYFGVPFAVIPSSVEEIAQGTGLDQVQALALQKGAEIFGRYPGYPVLSADTLVCLDNAVLGKPETHEQAERMLSALSGHTHQVVTGVCLFLPDGSILKRTATTDVLFRSIGKTELARYAASEEPMDKAGAYAMQGTGSMFIDRIVGSPSNVIGLPLCEVKELLEDAGLYP
ncbi:MAG TPA: Maf family protein [Candidatus Limiplasma sp.]|nr:Maf family protein [Candidatus Limiplasma sp.]HRX09054.1 Maf family protein [Candidatus Limiplasma sp.]